MAYLGMLLPPLTLLALFFIMKKGRLHRGGDGFLMLLYMSTFVFSYILLALGFQSVFAMSIFSMLILSLMMLIFFSPLALIGGKEGITIRRSAGQSPLVVLAWVLIIGGFFSIGYFLEQSIVALSGDIDSNRKLVYAGLFRNEESGILGFVATGFATFYGLNQLLAFYLLKNDAPGVSPERRRLFWLLIISSVSQVFYILSTVGRDGLVFWMLSLLYLNALFNKITGENIIYRYKAVVICALSVLMVPFLMITFSRFSGEVLYGIISYLGQMPYYFNEEVLIDRPLMGGLRNFPVFFHFFTDSSLDNSDWRYYYERAGTYEWLFPYFFGSLIKDFGVLGTILMLLAFAIFGYFAFCRLKASKIINFDQIFFLYFYAQVGFMGVFYFRHYAFNNYIIASFVLYIGLRIFRSRVTRPITLC